MKLLKTLTCGIAAAAALAFCASSAKAQTVVGVTTDFSKINISISVVTNSSGASKGSSSNYVYTVKTGKASINNKSLIALFATWSTNSLAGWQSAGAQLIYDWDSDEVCVADKTGTNIFYYVPTSGNNYLWFETDFEDGAYSGSYTYKNFDETSWNENDMDFAKFQFESWNGNESEYIYIDSHGTDNEHNSGKYVPTYSWTRTDSIQAHGWGTFDGLTATISSVDINMSGHGN